MIVVAKLAKQYYQDIYRKEKNASNQICFQLCLVCVLSLHLEGK